MIFIFLGPPGSGKGTQAKKLSARFSLPHIAVGDILREAILEGTAVGKIAAKYVEGGNLVPDEVTIDLVEERIKNPDCKNGFILDGFPRSMAQAKALDRMLSGLSLKLIYIDAPKEMVVLRNSGRLSCPDCGAVYHIKNNPPQKEGVCDRCGGKLYQRKDDTEEVIENRFTVYKQATAPVIEYYKDRLVKVDGSGVINEVFERLLSALGV